MSDELTISAAVQRFEVSRKTVRRRLAEGAIEGARQRPGDHGPEWVFPASSLEALGYRSRSDSAAAGDTEASVEPVTPAVTGVIDDTQLASSIGDIEAEHQFDETAADERPRRLTGIWVLLALVFGPLLGFLVANLLDSDDDGPTQPLAAVLAELTRPGEEIGVVEPLGAALPADRVAVALDDLDLEGAGSPTRYVVIGAEGPDDVRQALLASTQAVLALDEAAEPVWIFDTEAEPVLASATSAVPTTDPATTGPPSTGPPETSGPVTTETPTTVAPTTTVTTTTATTTAAPSTTTAPTTTPPDTGPEVDGEGAPDVDPGAGSTIRGSVTVQDGDHFWSIAEDVVSQSMDATPTDAQITGYWAQLVELNADQLVDPGNPDLLLPGQVLQLPPL